MMNFSTLKKIILFFIFLPSMALSSTYSPAEVYFNHLTSFQANFVQCDSSGIEQNGEVLILKPGLIRWDYYYPNPISILMEGRMLSYYDREIDEYNYSLVPGTIHSLLTVQDFKSLEQVKVLREGYNGDYFSIFFKDMKLDCVIEVIFNKNSMILSALNITSSGETSNIKFYNISYNKDIDKVKFHINKSISSYE